MIDEFVFFFTVNTGQVSAHIVADFLSICPTFFVFRYEVTAVAKKYLFILVIKKKFFKSFTVILQAMA